jgi:hypothetical protein
MDNNNAPGEQLSEEPQSERGATGSRDTGSDKPSGGPTDRPEGAVDDEAVPSHSGSEEGKFGGAGTRPPEDTGAALPPYEGRQTSSKPIGQEGAEGGVKPIESSGLKAPAPESTPRGATASPGDEQPAEEQPETDRGYDTTGPAHTPGTGRGENKN